MPVAADEPLAPTSSRVRRYHVIASYFSPARATRSLLTIATALGLMMSSPSYAQFVPTPMYVDYRNVNGPWDGTTWATAWPTLDSGIANQFGNGALYVRQGTYKIPYNSTGITYGFLITKKIQIYGAFLGTETGGPASRLGSATRTFLEGTFTDQNHNPPQVIKAYHVVTIQGVTGSSGQAGVVIDGFTIQDGNGFWNNGAAWPTNSNNVGGGIWSTCSDVDIANCYIKNNSALEGGGMHFSGGCDGIDPLLIPNTLHIKSSEFTANACGFGTSSQGNGGGLYAKVVRGEIANTRFSDNGGVLAGGVELYNLYGNDFNFTNCIFWRNGTWYQPAVGGGGIYISSGGSAGQSGNSTIVNCTFADNTGSGDTPGLALLANPAGNVVSVYNSVFYYNWMYTQVDPILGASSVSFSDTETIWTGTGSGNITGNPQFYDHANGILTLLTSPNASPCIDSADYDYLPLDYLDVDNDGVFNEVIPTDIANRNRMRDVQNPPIQNTGIGYPGCQGCNGGWLDMGAYEHPGV